MADTSNKILAALLSISETLDAEECRTLFSVLENGGKISQSGRNRESFTILGLHPPPGNPDVIATFHSAEVAVKMAKRFCVPGSENFKCEPHYGEGRFSRIIFEAEGLGQDQPTLVFSSAKTIRVVAYLSRPDLPPAEGEPDLTECVCCGAFREKLPSIFFGQRVCVLCGFKLEDWARDAGPQVQEIRSRLDSGRMNWNSVYSLVFGHIDSFGLDEMPVATPSESETKNVNLPSPESPQTETSLPAEFSAGEEIHRPREKNIVHSVEIRDSDIEDGESIASHSEPDLGDESSSQPEGSYVISQNSETVQEEDNDDDGEEEEYSCFICDVILEKRSAFSVTCVEEDCGKEAIVCRKCCDQLDTTQGRCLDCWKHFSAQEEEDRQEDEGIIDQESEQIVFSDASEEKPKQKISGEKAWNVTSLRKFMKMANAATPKKPISFSRSDKVLSSGDHEYFMSKTTDRQRFRYNHKTCRLFYENKKWQVEWNFDF